MNIDIAKVKPTGKGGKTTKDDVLKFAEEQKSAPAAPKAETEVKVLATPAVRELARKMNVDITKVKATGKGGKTTKEDILKFAEDLKAKPAPAAAAQKPSAQKAEVPSLGDKVIKLEGLAKDLARAISVAAFIPHYSVMDEFSIESIKKLAAIYKTMNPEKEISYLPFIMKAISIAMQDLPMFNGSTTSPSVKGSTIQDYIQKANHNIGIVLDTPKGIAVPNVKSVQLKSLIEINEDVMDLEKRAKANQLTAYDFQDTTFTITSYLNIGGIAGTPKVFNSQIATATIGAPVLFPVFASAKKDEIKYAFKETSAFTVTYDHRVVDPATGTKFLANIKKNIESLEYLLWSRA